MGKMACKSNDRQCPCPRCTRDWYSRRHETTEARDAARVAYSTRAQRRTRKQRWNPSTRTWEVIAA